ncbi:MAG: VanZ family protein [Acetatifactor sp.]|nr:VanZ family protein [Acetatifactor sp.]
MYTYGMLFWVPVNIIYFAIISICGLVKKRRREYYFFAAVFCIYMNFLIDKAFFPIFTDGAEFYVSLEKYVNLDISLLFSYTPYQIIGNFLMMFPLGILLVFIINGKIQFQILLSVLISLMIEVVQLLMIMSLHLIDVTFDINDIILNVGGCLFGHLVFYLFCKIYIRRQDRTNTISVIEYFDKVCSNYVKRKSSLDGLRK